MDKHKLYHIVSGYTLEEDSYDTTLEHSDNIDDLLASARKQTAKDGAERHIVQHVRTVSVDRKPYDIKIEEII